jgi:hypothetical protein
MQAQNKSPLNAKYRAIEPPPMIKIKANHHGIISTSNSLWQTLYQIGFHQPRVGRTAFIEPNALNPLIKWWEFKNKVSHALPRWEYVKIMKEVGFKDAKSQPFEFTPSNFNFRVNWLEKIQLVKELAGSVIITID